jgi:hypothetical protein
MMASTILGDEYATTGAPSPPAAHCDIERICFHPFKGTYRGIIRGYHETFVAALAAVESILPREECHSKNSREIAERAVHNTRILDLLHFRQFHKFTVPLGFRWGLC